MPLAERLAHVQCELADHPPQCLLAASKGVVAERLRHAYALGLRHLGENYLQEALDKQMALRDLDGIVWHFIGRIQRNKTAAIARHFDWVESVDRPLIAERLDTARAGMVAPLNVLIEVAVSAEDNKGGCAPEEVPALALVISRLSNLRLRGLMALVHPQPEQAIADFRRMAELFLALQQTKVHTDLDTLSMGTSADYLQALQHSATEIRLGTILFGARTQESL